jgi:large subunit ribosomal protein L2
MPLKKYRPITPTLRFTVRPDYSEITKTEPEKSLIEPLKKTGGRNNRGRLTCRHKGGGHKRFYRLVDFKRSRHEQATVEAIEYDPNRTARIALITYKDGTKSYILAPVGLNVGDKVNAGPDAEPNIGCALPLHKIPVGTLVHNIELLPGQGAKIARSAGAGATLMGFSDDYAQLRMPSSEIRKVHKNCYATIGQVGNTDHENVTIGKAGRSRWLGIRPTVRGMAMNPVDHPNGGGQGKSKGGGGRQHLVSPWGQLARGLKTRKKSKITNKFIVERRKK